MRRPLTRGLTLLPFLAALVAATTVGVAPSAHACNLADYVYLETFDATAEPERQQYVLGETAIVHARVMRPGDTDPLGLGIPIPAGQQLPAANVWVSLSLRFPKGYAFGWGRTDDDGQAVLQVPLSETRITPGSATATIYAYADYPTVCTTIYEFDFEEIPDFLTAVAP